MPAAVAGVAPVPAARRAPVLGPERLEVYGEADLASPVHLGCLALQLRQFNLRSHGRVGGGHVKAEVKLVLDEVVHVPAHSTAAWR
jgi:hypothetical protein